MTQEEKEAAAKKEFQISENTTEGDKGKLEWLQEIFIRGLTHRDTEVEELKAVIRELVKNCEIIMPVAFTQKAQDEYLKSLSKAKQIIEK